MPLETLLAHSADTYNEFAPRYDTVRFTSPHGQYDFEQSRALVKDIVIEVLGDGRSGPWKALDVGSGTGRIAVLMAKLGGSVSALDGAPEMLHQCILNARAERVEERVKTVHASAQSIPFPDNSFDVVSSFRFLHLFPSSNYEALLAEMVRVTKPGGHVIVEFKNSFYGLAIYALRDKRENVTYGVSSRQIHRLAKDLNLTLCDLPGHLLPKCWHFRNNRTLSAVARWMARRPLRSVAFSRIAVFRKELVHP